MHCQHLADKNAARLIDDVDAAAVPLLRGPVVESRPADRIVFGEPVV